MAPTLPRAISDSGRHHIPSYESTFRSRSFAEASLEYDLAECSDDDTDIENNEGELMRARSAPARHNGALDLGHPRRSVVAIGSRPAIVPTMAAGERPGSSSGGAAGGGPNIQRWPPSDLERARKEERSLLRDNRLLPPKTSAPDSGDGGAGGRRRSVIGNVASSLSRVFSNQSSKSQQDQHAVSDGGESGTTDGGGADASERTPLLGTLVPDGGKIPSDGDGEDEDISKKWKEAVASGAIHTTWQREAKTLASYSKPLIAAFLLQYSLTVTSIFTVGHLGKVPLGAVSLASMTSNITGWAIYQGLATSLDTLCAQAYGSGKRKLVGLQLQRMVLFLWMVTIPIAIIWLSAGKLLALIVPEKELAALAGTYLKIVLIGTPGYALFESGKRFMQAQGLFAPTLHILLVCAPLNVLMHWLFVWKFGWGFVGAPIAVCISDNLLAISLVFYIKFIAGSECWGGFSRKAWHNWGPMIRLAVPGLLMVEAEFLAFEILTLASAWFGTTALASQSVLSTISSITFQIPFPLSVAASTRIANLIGATLKEPAKVAARVALVAGALIGCLNFALLLVFKEYIPRLFTNDEEVIELVKKTLPVVVSFQLFDALATNCSGILRAIGRQEIGGYVNLFCYYVVALPISIGTGFGLHWELYGLWAGPVVGLFLVFCTEAVFIYRTDWQRSVEEAKRRNESE